MAMSTGNVLEMQRKAKLRGDLEPITEANVSVDMGIEGDLRGRMKNAQITLVSKEAWAATMADLKPETDLSWSVRRANVLVEGMDFNECLGATITIGEVVLEVMEETDPCEIMEAVHTGLKDALTPDWRGGARTKVVKAGVIRIGDSVTMERV